MGWALILTCLPSIDSATVKASSERFTLLAVCFPHPHVEKSSNFRSKTLTFKNKNKIFAKFLSPFWKTSYESQVTKNSEIFVPKPHIRLIIEGLLFSPQPVHRARTPRRAVLNLSHLNFNINNMEYTLDVSSLACLSGDIRISSLWASIIQL